LFYSSASVSHNTVTGNSIDHGGELSLQYSAGATLTGNHIAGNDASEGGGLYLWSSNSTVSGNAIYSNTASTVGGGLSLAYGDASVDANEILFNAADQCGGGIYLAGEGSLTNNVIAQNRLEREAATGSGACIQGAHPRLVHNTLAQNSGGDGSGVYVADYFSDYSHAVMTNTILVSHAVGVKITAGNTTTLEATLWGNGVEWDGAGTLLIGTVNVWGAAAFVAPEEGDYHLTPDSAAVDRGVDTGVGHDVDNDPRPDGAAPDLGADELGTASHRVYLPLVLR
jgi:parallel beta-helix repeat protein